jgi:hypothetical protein
MQCVEVDNFTLWKCSRLPTSRRAQDEGGLIVLQNLVRATHEPANADVCWLVKPLKDAQSWPRGPAVGADDALVDCVASIMIRNGLYLAETTFLDGVEAYNRHVMVLRDGTMRGGGGYYYTVGSYTCSGSKWKGEMTSREHSPISLKYPWAGKVITIGFTGTYSDDGAEFEATALAGKQSFRFKSVYRLLVAD